MLAFESLDDVPPAIVAERHAPVELHSHRAAVVGQPLTIRGILLSRFHLEVVCVAIVNRLGEVRRQRRHASGLPLALQGYICSRRSQRREQQGGEESEGGVQGLLPESLPMLCRRPSHRRQGGGLFRFVGEAEFLRHLRLVDDVAIGRATYSWSSLSSDQNGYRTIAGLGLVTSETTSHTACANGLSTE